MKKIILGVIAAVILIGGYTAYAQYYQQTPPNPIPEGGWVNPDPTFHWPQFVVKPDGTVYTDILWDCDFPKPPVDVYIPKGSYVLYQNSKTHVLCKFQY